MVYVRGLRREFGVPKTGIMRARLRYSAALKKAGPMVMVTMYLGDDDG